MDNNEYGDMRRRDDFIQSALVGMLIGPKFPLLSPTEYGKVAVAIADSAMKAMDETKLESRD